MDRTKCAKTGKAVGMAYSFAALRHPRLVPALLALSLAFAGGVKAQDAPSEQPSAAAVQKPGEKSGGAKAPIGPSAEQHRLPPDSTTKQTVVLPGRTLAFSATAGSIRLFDGK